MQKEIATLYKFKFRGNFQGGKSLIHLLLDILVECQKIGVKSYTKKVLERTARGECSVGECLQNSKGPRGPLRTESTAKPGLTVQGLVAP